MNVEFEFENLLITFKDDYFERAELYLKTIDGYFDATDLVLENQKLMDNIADKYYELGGSTEALACQRENEIDRLNDR